jgi:hypothetical protein
MATKTYDDNQANGDLADGNNWTPIGVPTGGQDCELIANATSGTISCGPMLLTGVTISGTVDITCTTFTMDSSAVVETGVVVNPSTSITINDGTWKIDLNKPAFNVTGGNVTFIDCTFIVSTIILTGNININNSSIGANITAEDTCTLTEDVVITGSLILLGSVSSSLNQNSLLNNSSISGNFTADNLILSVIKGLQINGNCTITNGSGSAENFIVNNNSTIVGSFTFTNSAFNGSLNILNGLSLISCNTSNTTTLIDVQTTVSFQHTNGTLTLNGSCNLIENVDGNNCDVYLNDSSIIAAASGSLNQGDVYCQDTSQLRWRLDDGFIITPWIASGADLVSDKASGLKLKLIGANSGGGGGGGAMIVSHLGL